MTEKTLSILGVIKKKLDSLDRGKKTKTVDNSLDNEFDYVVPAKKNSTSDNSKEANNSITQDSSSTNSNTADTKNETVGDKKSTTTDDKKSNDILANPDLDLDKEDGFKNPLNLDNSSKDQYDFDIEDLIEEYEDQVGDEDLDGGSFSSIAYNLKIDNKEVSANSVSPDSQFSKTTADLDFDKINLNFSDELNSAQDKLFGSSKPKNDQTQSSPTSLLSKLTDQFKSKQTTESTESKASKNQELNLDFDLKIDTDNIPNITQQQNLSDKISEPKIEIDNKVIVEESKSQFINEEKKVVKDEIDLEFEKQLLQLPDLDQEIPSVKNETKTTQESLEPSPTAKETISQTPQENDHHFNLPNDSELSELELAEAKMFNNNSQPNSTVDDLAKSSVELDLHIQQPQALVEQTSLDKTDPQPQVLTEQTSFDKIDEVKNEILQEQIKPAENNSENLLNSQAIKDQTITENFTNNEIKNNELPSFTNSSQFSQNNTSQSLKVDFDLSNFTANVSEKVSKTILNDDVLVKTNSSIQKLIETKNMMAGINNFMQSPYPAQIALQLMEPKLEKWLNENLANLVEKIVSEEIKKIIPKEIK